jgi:hypothetical protein
MVLGMLSSWRDSIEYNGFPLVTQQSPLLTHARVTHEVTDERGSSGVGSVHLRVAVPSERITYVIGQDCSNFSRASGTPPDRRLSCRRDSISP